MDARHPERDIILHRRSIGGRFTFAVGASDCRQWCGCNNSHQGPSQDLRHSTTPLCEARLAVPTTASPKLSVQEQANLSRAHEAAAAYAQISNPLHGAWHKICVSRALPTVSVSLCRCHSLLSLACWRCPASQAQADSRLGVSRQHKSGGTDDRELLSCLVPYAVSVFRRRRVVGWRVRHGSACLAERLTLGQAIKRARQAGQQKHECIGS